MRDEKNKVLVYNFFLPVLFNIKFQNILGVKKRLHICVEPFVPWVGVQLMQSDIIFILLQIDKKLIFYNTFKTFVDDYITALYLIK